MGQCQLMLEDNNEKNNKKILYLSDLQIWRLKRCSCDLVYFKYILKKILTICFLLASGIIILNDCDQICKYFLHYFQHFQVVILCPFYLK
jgi:hypothetical protein